MGLKSWFTQKAADKGKSNIVDSLTKLIPVCDAQWDRTVAAVTAQQWPLPKQDPNVDRCRRDLIQSLMVFKGPLTDKEALAVVSSTMATLGARFGAQMAIRYLVMEEWPKQDRNFSLTQDEMEKALGTREKDKEQTELFQQSALRHLAMEQAAKDVTGR